MKNRISSIMDTSKKRLGTWVLSLMVIATLSTGFAFTVSANTVTESAFTLTVEDVTPRNVRRAANTITANEAAQYAAQHIKELFDISVDGSAVQTNYNARNNQWVVTVADSAERMAENWNFRITLDARDGEWVSVDRNGRTQSPSAAHSRLFTPSEGSVTTETFTDNNGRSTVVPQGNVRFTIPFSNEALEGWFSPRN